MKVYMQIIYIMYSRRINEVLIHYYLLFLFSIYIVVVIGRVRRLGGKLKTPK